MTEAQLQSLLNVQSNLSTVSTNIEKNMLNKIEKLEKTMKEKIPEIKSKIINQLINPSDNSEWSELTSEIIPTIFEENVNNTGKYKTVLTDNNLNEISSLTAMYSNNGVPKDSWNYELEFKRLLNGEIVNNNIVYYAISELNVNPKSKNNLMTIKKFENYIYSCKIKQKKNGSCASLSIAIGKNSDGSLNLKYIDIENGIAILRDSKQIPYSSKSTFKENIHYKLEIKVWKSGIEIILNDIISYAGCLIGLDGYIGILCNNNIEISHVRLEYYDRYLEASMNKNNTEIPYNDIFVQDAFYNFNEGINKLSFQLAKTNMSFMKGNVDGWNDVISKNLIKENQIPFTIKNVWTFYDSENVGHTLDTLKSIDFSKENLEDKYLINNKIVKIAKETITLTFGDYFKYRANFYDLVSVSLKLNNLDLFKDGDKINPRDNYTYIVAGKNKSIEEIKLIYNSINLIVPWSDRTFLEKLSTKNRLSTYGDKIILDITENAYDSTTISLSQNEGGPSDDEMSIYVKKSTDAMEKINAAGLLYRTLDKEIIKINDTINII